MKFNLFADCEFDADNIDDAFVKLAKHFLTLHEGEDSPLINNGQIEVVPVETK